MSEFSNKECNICCQRIEIYSVGQCNHRAVCCNCSIKLRKFYCNFSCPLCREELSNVIITKDKRTPFNSFKLEESLKIDNGLYSENNELKEMINHDLLSIRCPVCVKGYPKWYHLQFTPHLTPDRVFSSNTELVNHVKKEHRLCLCEICLNNRKIFSFEQILFLPRTLSNHLSNLRETTEEKEAGIPIHKKCEICKEWYFSENDYFEHADNIHIPCFLCGCKGIHIYFSDNSELDNHNKSCHFKCEYIGCMAVFDDEYELRIHKKREHNDKNATILNLSDIMMKDSKKITPSPPPSESPSSPSYNNNNYNNNNRRQGRDRERNGKYGRRGGREGRGGRRNNTATIEQQQTPPPQSLSDISPHTPHTPSSNEIFTIENFPKLGEESNSNNNNNSLFSTETSTNNNNSSVGTTSSRLIHKNVFIVEDPSGWSEEEIKRRNDELMIELQISLYGNKEKFERFKSDSKKYLNNHITAEGFHDLFLALFGKENIYLFGKLISLLPNPKKRKDLEVAYRKAEGKPLISRIGESKKYSVLESELINKRNEMKVNINENNLYYLSIHEFCSQLLCIFDDLVCNRKINKTIKLSKETIEIMNKINTIDIIPHSLEYLLSNEEINEEVYNILYEIIINHYILIMNNNNNNNNNNVIIVDVKLLNIDEISKIKEKLNKESSDDDLMKCKSFYNEILNEIYDRCMNMRYLNEMNILENNRNIINSSSSNNELNKNSKWNNSTVMSINEKFPLLPTNNDNSIPIIPKINKTTNNKYLDGLISTNNKSKSKIETLEEKIDNAMKQLNETKNGNGSSSENNKKNKKKKSKGILLTSY